jgi:DNA-binding MarR family transcriptional regulator
MDMPESDRWTFFTNHAHILFCLAEAPELRLRDLADRVGVTERAAQRIVGELERAGYVEVERVGRRNRYRLNVDKQLRHPIEAHRSVADLVKLLVKDG